MRLDVDVAILGGGCAGLSLAVALAESRSALRVLVLEQRTTYLRDRTWCLWNTTPHPFTQCVTHEWARWRIRSDNRSVVQASKRYRYQHIAADRFYAAATSCITRERDQELALGANVIDIRRAAGVFLIETSLGLIRAQNVFDSRPPKMGSAYRGLVQRFTGWHVRTNRSVFDPGIVDLMDFTRSDVAGRTQFFYVLPFSPNEAMVEVTYLDSPLLPPADAEKHLRHWLEEATEGGSYEILFREQGALPMLSKLPGIEDVAYNIGVRGGRVKPSSGYAFLRIQRQSRDLAAALARKQPLPRRFEPLQYRWMDRVFLDALILQPGNVAAYFLQLFDQVPSDRLVRFLSEEGSWLECLQVALALPKTPFLRAVFGSRGIAA